MPTNKVDVREGDGFFAGSNFVIEFQALAQDGTPENINGWTLSYTWRRRADQAVADLTKTIAGGGITITNPSQGQGIISFVPADTDNVTIKPGVYIHRLTRTDTGSVSSIIPGRGYKSSTVVLLPKV